jgi:hypothetical protein
MLFNAITVNPKMQVLAFHLAFISSFVHMFKNCRNGREVEYLETNISNLIDFPWVWKCPNNF